MGEYQKRVNMLLGEVVVAMHNKVDLFLCGQITPLSALSPNLTFSPFTGEIESVCDSNPKSSTNNFEICEGTECRDGRDGLCRRITGWQVRVEGKEWGDVWFQFP